MSSDFKNEEELPLHEQNYLNSLRQSGLDHASKIDKIAEGFLNDLKPINDRWIGYLFASH